MSIGSLQVLARKAPQPVYWVIGGAFTTLHAECRVLYRDVCHRVFERAIRTQGLVFVARSSASAEQFHLCARCVAPGWEPNLRIGEAAKGAETRSIADYNDATRLHLPFRSWKPSAALQRSDSAAEAAARLLISSA